MSGHSKWSTIKHKKAREDARRGKLFTKLVRELTISARLGGGDPDANPRLRAAIQEARNANVPADNIDRAIKKGTGELEGAEVEEAAYEGYGPGGVAVLVETVTDNRNRTVSEIRNLFSRHGGSMGEAGCVAWMFDKKGYFEFDSDLMDDEAFMELALELEVEDVQLGDDSYELYASGDSYGRISQELDRRGLKATREQLIMLPQSTLQVDADAIGKLLALLDALDEHDDTQNVWANLDESCLPDEIAEKAAS